MDNEIEEMLQWVIRWETVASPELKQAGGILREALERFLQLLETDEGNLLRPLLMGLWAAVEAHRELSVCTLRKEIAYLEKRVEALERRRGYRAPS